jgi:hypothetical protein
MWQSRELGGTGLRGTLFYHKILSPTVEPDPDNAGGGKLQRSSRPSLGGFFYPRNGLHSKNLHEFSLITARLGPKLPF